MNKVNTNKKGFTLLELLIVIAIIAVLSVLLIIVLDPAETLKRARDSQRVSDLNTIKTALGIYLTSTTSPLLDFNGKICFGQSPTALISYSAVNTVVAACAGVSPVFNPGTDSVSSSAPFATAFCTSSPVGTYTAVDGSGWIPVNFLALSGGSPISNLPVDPVNTVASIHAPTDTDLVYRYVCQQQTTVTSLPARAYQLAAVLESNLYGGATGLASKDGAPNVNYYQVGSDSRLTPPTSTLW